MTETMLSDVGATHDLRFVTLRYFNVAGADPMGRAGQSTRSTTHLIKVAAQAAFGRRASLEIFGTDYPTADGTCIRDYIHVSDLTSAHLSALSYLRGGGKSEILNCGYGRGYSVREVIASVKRVSNCDFPVSVGPRRPGDPAELVAGIDRITRVLRWSQEAPPPPAGLLSYLGRELINTSRWLARGVRYGTVSGLKMRRTALPGRATSSHFGGPTAT